ncbi:MAG: hypothetical protein HUU56_02250 [Bdellovibrionaceae bacterium]|nr:hypothetical protein [Pseudobdellovibrionaceae bacterium]
MKYNFLNIRLLSEHYKVSNKKIPVLFLHRSWVLLIGLVLPYSLFRIYLYINLYLVNHSFNFFDLIQMLWMGLRFDLCVTGFLFIPIYLIALGLFLFNFNWVVKVLKFLGHSFIALVYVVVFCVYFLNLPFFIKNARFGIPFWMRSEDYRSLWDLTIYPSYWSFNYLSEFQFTHVILVILFSLLMSLTVIPLPQVVFKRRGWVFISYLLVIILLARGKIGQHHLRYEDSLFSKYKLVNELSLNPLWVFDKSKEQLSQNQGID